jgi:cysteine desulfurase family protein (TIGR01976 family)
MRDVASLRQQFPALQRTIHGRSPVYLDGPGGTQVPQRVIDAIVHYLSTCNANHGGVFTTGRESDAIVQGAHDAVRDFLGARSADEVVFGANMTTLTFHLSRALARTWKPGDVVVVTRLDHDANVRPWVLAARDVGAEVRFVDFHSEDCTLDHEDLSRVLEGGRVRLLAVTCASNAVGTRPDVPGIIQQAHRVGAKVFLDAVHYAPHAPIDVQAWDCDFLACSAYKFFGPHVGILWGREEWLRELPVYKVQPATEDLPGRWMTGTQNHEGLAGVAAAIDYLASLGAGVGRRERLLAAMGAIQSYETDLARRLLAGLREQPRFRVYGITREDRLRERTPTVSITARDRSVLQIAEHLARHEIYAWHGNFYAQELTERLGVEAGGGLLRLGLVHYNTADEVERTLRALEELP